MSKSEATINHNNNNNDKTKGTKLAHTFKSDVLFKMLFVKHPELLKRMTAALLSIPLESIEHFQTINTEISPEEVGVELCKLEINMTAGGERINLEIQIENSENHPDGIMYRWGRIFITSMLSGDVYPELSKTIIISILNFVQFDCEVVHSEFAPMEVSRKKIMSDKQQYHFFELPKMPDVDSLDFTSEKDLWLALFNAQTEEELEKLKANGGEVMVQAVEAYKGITASQEFQALEMIREKNQA